MNGKDNINHIYDIASKRIKFFRKYRGLTQEQLSMNSTFSRGFIGNIESPAAEDGQYVAGTPAVVILTTSTGVEIKRETTSTFPVSFNVSGIKGAEDGYIVIVYPVTIPGSTTTNENGEVVTTPETVEDRSIRRTVKFAKE